MANLNSFDLKAVEVGGLINEDVMQQIWDISRIPLDFTESISSDTVKNSYTEYTQDKLQDVNMSNAQIDGSDQNTNNDTNTGSRVGSHCQISTKTVSVSTRADDSDTIGRSNELAYQVMMRQQELKRDVEAISISEQGSQSDNGSDTPGLSAGFASWLTTNTFRGAGGADGGFAAGQTAAPTPGTTRALSEALVRDCAQSVWEQGGNPTTLMSNPTVIRKLSEYMFTETAKVATLTSDVREKSSAATATGSVNLFITDFGVTLMMVPNRLQQPVVATPGSRNCTLYCYDPEYVRHGYLAGYRVEPLAKIGLADTRMMAVDWTLKCLNESAHGLIADIDDELAVVA